LQETEWQAPIQIAADTAIQKLVVSEYNMMVNAKNAKPNRNIIISLTLFPMARITKIPSIPPKACAEIK
jgi:hypothetical protein